MATEINVVNEQKAALDVDQELQQLLERIKTKIVVVGTGGAGCNTISRMYEVGIEGAQLIAMNTDAQHLFITKSPRKLLLGKELTGGLGAGSTPTIGEEAAKESERGIKETLQGADMVFIACGLGGGTGSGSAPVIGELATKIGALTIAIVTMPFSVEGLIRRENAEMCLERLQKAVDTVIVIPNDKLLDVCPNLPLQAAFKVCDEILMRSVKGITEMVTKPGLVNLDFSDIRTIMEHGGLAMIGLGESDSENRVTEVVESAINSPLIDVDITGAKGALINITGGPDLTVSEAEKIVQGVSDKLDPRAHVIWGAQIDGNLGNALRVLSIVTGVESPHILGRAKAPSPAPSLTPEQKAHVGIDFIG
ncbi:MAG: cell division protein FtsZ [Euryarchaeota archaeon]|nr:cell division protein FtsZ [Euryarchaeota archaeon]